MISGRTTLGQVCGFAVALLASLIAGFTPALAADPIRSVHYSYDLMGRQLSARFDSPSGADGITNTYDGFGQLTSSQISMAGFTKSLTSPQSDYDAAGRRTKITHPDGQAFTYAYDARDRLTGVYQGTGTGTPLDTFAYNADDTLTSRTEGPIASPVATVGYTWDAIGRLATQSDAFPSAAASNVGWTFGRNPASQIVTNVRNNDAYAYGGISAVNRNYAVNGLNQYTTAGSSSYTYDANGNLITDGTNTYVYDIENRLVRATGGGVTTNVIYDPLGRLFQVDKGTTATTTRFLYDGDALVAEYDGTGVLTNRFVHGSNAAADDPLLWYVGSGTGTKRYLHADHLGSIVAVTNTSGGPSINTYDEYGIPKIVSGANANAGRFQYTGQAFIAELGAGMYYYKARMYSAFLGRFLQTDPTGYDDHINLYAYVGNDPINDVDPSGLASTCTGSNLGNGGEGTCSGVSGSSTASPTGNTSTVASSVSKAIHDTKKALDDTGKAVGQSVELMGRNLAESLTDTADAFIPDQVWQSNRAKEGQTGRFTSYGYDGARNKALRWLGKRGFKAERATIGKFGWSRGLPIGRQTADGRSGFRVEYDTRHRAHINAWSHKEKTTFEFTGDEDYVKSIIKRF